MAHPLLSDQRRIGDDTTESVEPNSQVIVSFFGADIHGKNLFRRVAGPVVAIEWIGKKLWWGGSSFNSKTPVNFFMLFHDGNEWRYTFQMIGQGPFSVSPTGPFLCV